MSLTTEQMEKLVPLLLSYNPEDQNQAQILIETLIDTENDFREFLKYMNVSPFSSVPTFEELKGCFRHLDNQQQNFMASGPYLCLPNGTNKCVFKLQC